MPIILTPLAAPSPGPVTCSDLGIISPNDAYNLYDCPVVMKTRTVILDAGVRPLIEWEIRDRNGKAVNFGGCLDNGAGLTGSIVVKFQEAMGCDPTVHSTAADVESATAGLIHFQPPQAIVNQAKIWKMQIGVYDYNDTLVFTDHGFVSVERGLFGSEPEAPNGPPTLQEIRTMLRDTLVENDLTDKVEYDDTEIIMSIVQPIMQWNETPPPVAIFTPYTFPWRYHWMHAIVAQLMKKAAVWFQRNKTLVRHGGVQDDERNRDQEYMTLALYYEKQWLEFMDAKKTEINYSLAYGHFS